jgi:hypothetical protein
MVARNGLCWWALATHTERKAAFVIGMLSDLRCAAAPPLYLLAGGPLLAMSPSPNRPGPVKTALTRLLLTASRQLSPLVRSPLAHPLSEGRQVLFRHNTRQSLRAHGATALLKTIGVHQWQRLESNQRLSGLQPEALPLSYIARRASQQLRLPTHKQLSLLHLQGCLPSVAPRKAPRRAMEPGCQTGIEPVAAGITTRQSHQRLP